MSDTTQQYKFFVLDDHASAKDGTVLSLQSAYPEIEIMSAQTAQEARRKIQGFDPDLVVADLSIPEAPDDTPETDTGIKLLREFLKAYPTFNYVVQSAYVKALVRIKPDIDAHQGGFTIVDKSESMQEMLRKVDWSLQGVVYTPRDMRVDLEIKPQWLKVLELAFREGMNDKAIAEEMHVAERTVRHYWTKIQDVLGVYPEEGKSLRIQTELQARREGFID